MILALPQVILIVKLILAFFYPICLPIPVKTCRQLWIMYLEVILTKLIVHNMIMRRRAIEKSSYIVQQQLGEHILLTQSLKKRFSMQITLLIGKFYTTGHLCVVHISFGHRGREVTSFNSTKKNATIIFTTGS